MQQCSIAPYVRNVPIRSIRSKTHLTSHCVHKCDLPVLPGPTANAISSTTMLLRFLGRPWPSPSS